GVQTCALPISLRRRRRSWGRWCSARSSGALLGGGGLRIGALPAGAGLGAGLDGVEDPLHLQRLLEGRRRVGALADRRDQIGDLVGEGVLVAEAVPGGPPARGVGVLGFGGQAAGEALAAARGGRVVDLELVHPLEVEG